MQLPESLPSFLGTLLFHKNAQELYMFIYILRRIKRVKKPLQHTPHPLVLEITLAHVLGK